MLMSLAIGGASCALGLCWALKVIKEEGVTLLNPTKNWDKKIDVILGLMTVAVTLTAGPMKGLIMTFLSLTFSVLIRYVPALRLA